MDRSGGEQTRKDRKKMYFRRNYKKSRRPVDPSCKVFVGNISYRIKEDELAEFFSEFGPIHFAEVVRDHKKGWSRGIGFVAFLSAESAKTALNARDEQLVLDGRLLRVGVPQLPKRQQDNADACSTMQEGVEEGVVEGVASVEAVTKSEECGAVGGILNDDILYEVFSYLPLKERIKSEMVCTQWQRVARKWWKSAIELNFDDVFVSFKGKYSALTDNILGSILSRGCCELRSLDVSASPSQLTDYSLHLIGLYCHKLRYLNISRVAVTPQSLKILTQRCNSLKVLIIKGCHSIGEKSLWWALHQCREIEELNVAHNRRLNGQCFYMSVPTLSTLSLCECVSMTDEGIALLAKHSPNIRCLNISKCNLLTGKSLRALAQHCSALQELHFCGPNAQVDSADFGVLVSPALEVLVVNEQISFNDHVLRAIAKVSALRSLSCAACYGVTDEGLKLISACHNLRELNVSYCHLVGDIGVAAVAEIGILHKLIARACPNLTDRGVVDVSNCCTELMELDISGCWQVTNKSLYALQENLLHMRGENKLTFSFTLGGTDIEGEAAVQFAAVTASSICLHNLSVVSLQADRNPLLEPVCLEGEEESWETEPAGSWLPEAVSDYCMEKAYDWLEADDPALFSDEFSEPEEWNMY